MSERPERFLRIDEVINRTGLTRTAIYRQIKCKQFPNSVPLGQSAVGWLESEINQWIQNKINQRNQKG